jgi:hypothetical protein
MSNTVLSSPVILNLFQDPSRLTALSVQAEKWTLKQVQGDEGGEC